LKKNQQAWRYSWRQIQQEAANDQVKMRSRFTSRPAATNSRRGTGALSKRADAGPTLDTMKGTEAAAMQKLIKMPRPIRGSCVLGVCR
jgi:hypothetical protein